MTDRWTCRIVDAKAAHRAWSKQRTLVAIFAAAIAASVTVPSFALADEVKAPDAADTASAAVTGDPEDAAGSGIRNTAVTGGIADPDASDEVANAESSFQPATETVDEAPNVQAVGSPQSVEASQQEFGAASADTTAGGLESPSETPVPAVALKSSALPTEDPSILKAPSPSSDDTNADALGSDIQFDYNGDGKTTQDDWDAYLYDILAERYISFDDDVSSGNRDNSHAPGTQWRANGDLRDEAISALTAEDISKIRSYYLNNVGQATSVKDQDVWNDCWSFAVVSALESSILKARAGAAGQLVNPADHAMPKLTGIEDKGLDLSELYFAWLAHGSNASGSQKGEGLRNNAPQNVRSEWEARLGSGFTSFADELFGAWRGIANEKDFPYFSAALRAYLQQQLDASGFAGYSKKDYERLTPEPSEQKNARQVAHVNGVYYLPSPNRTEVRDGKVVWAGHDSNADLLIKQALVKYGAVAISYRCVDDNTYQYYSPDHAAQYNYSTTASSNHAVTIVGWNDDFDPNNFLVPDYSSYEYDPVTGEGHYTRYLNEEAVKNLPKGAWLIKNSWGDVKTLLELFGGYMDDATYTGIDGSGYFWLSYYDRTITNPMCFSVDDASDGFDYQHNYSYDTATSNWQTPFALRTADAGTMVSNVFTAQGNETLKAVSVRTSQPNSHAVIYVYLVSDADLKDNDPTNDGAPVSVMECDLGLAGLHTVSLKTPVSLKKGQRFAIVENVTSNEPASDSSKKMSWLNLETEIAQWVQNQNPASNDYWHSTLLANDGETFARVLTKDGYRWLTPQQLAKAILDGKVIEFGSAMVKAFTVNTDGSVTPTRPAGRGNTGSVVTVITQDGAGRRHVRAGQSLYATKTGDEKAAGYAPRHLARASSLPGTDDVTDPAPLVGLASLAAALLGLGTRLGRRRHAEQL